MLIFGNMKIHLYHVSFTDPETVRVIEIFPQGGQGLVYLA